MLLAVRISSYGCTWEVWRALKRLELHSAAPRATLTPLSCSRNFPRAQYLDIRTLTHELIVNYNIADKNACFLMNCKILVTRYTITNGSIG